MYRNSATPLQPLFPNHNLDGWHSTGTATWTFEEEVLHGYSGEEPSYLVSEKA